MSSEQNVKVVVADPSALGLFGLAIVTIVASSEKLGWTNSTALIIPWAIFLGSFAQLFAAIGDAKRNNLFGTTAFGAFAFFWLAVAMTWLISSGAFGEVLQSKADISQLGFAFIGYLIFCLYMTIGSMETNKVLFIDFIFIDLLFIGLIGYTFTEKDSSLHSTFRSLAGWSELIISMISFYGSAGVVLNGHFGRSVIPMGKGFGIFKK